MLNSIAIDTMLSCDGEIINSFNSSKSFKFFLLNCNDFNVILISINLSHISPSIYF
jgi:hypothetical protein